MLRNTPLTQLLLVLFLGWSFDAPSSASSDVAETLQKAALVSVSPGLLQWSPLVESGGLTLTLANPEGEIHIHHFSQGEAPALSLFDTQGAPLLDGTYTWELRLTPDGSAPLVQSGYFTISGGKLVAPDLAEPPAEKLRVATAPDQMVPDDLIVDGKGCIGLGCVNNEAFGAEALRLKQSVVRLRFQDTSSNAGIPTNDWQITVNDSASGGANRFSIEDVDGAKTPLTLRAGAPDSSVYVDSTGRVGLGTATPAERLHVLESADANTIITSENTSTGLSAAGALRAKSNAATVNFQAHGNGRTLSRFGQPLASWAEFLQVTGNGLIIGTLTDKPLILGTNSTNRLQVTPDGNVGLGITAPAAQLHVFSSASGGKALFENTNPTAAAREMFEVRNKGGAAVIFDDTNDPTRWANTALGPNFLFNNQANPGVEYTFGPTGDLTLAGTLTQNSDRFTKTDIQAVDPREVLASVSEVPISTWRKIGDSSTHLGPMAQDFKAAFGLGDDERHIAPGDLAGVSLAAIQGLHALVEEQRQQIEQQQELIRLLEERLTRLEGRQ